MTLLHSGIEKELTPLIDRCLVLAVDRDVPEIMANVLYATSHAGKPHQATRIGTEFVARYRQGGAHPGALLATLYTNILLAYGSTATCDDACRSLTLELEQLLDEDPAYFGASGNAHRNILPSAYGSAACGRCVMGDGERAAAAPEVSARFIASAIISAPIALRRVTMSSSTLNRSTSSDFIARSCSRYVASTRSDAVSIRIPSCRLFDRERTSTSSRIPLPRSFSSPGWICTQYDKMGWAPAIPMIYPGTSENGAVSR